MAIIDTHLTAHVTTLTTFTGDFLLRCIGFYVSNHVFWCLYTWLRFGSRWTFSFFFLTNRTFLSACIYRCIGRFFRITAAWLTSAFFCFVGILGITWAASIVATVTAVSVSCTGIGCFSFNNFYGFSFFAWCKHGTDCTHKLAEEAWLWRFNFHRW